MPLFNDFWPSKIVFISSLAPVARYNCYDHDHDITGPIDAKWIDETIAAQIFVWSSGEK